MASPSLFTYAFVRPESEQNSSRSETIRDLVIGIPVVLGNDFCVGVPNDESMSAIAML